MESTCPRIHIIANCANRKRMPPVAELNSISQTDIKTRVDAWWEKLNDSSTKISENANLFQSENGKLRAENLYIGSYWSTIRSLSEKAQVSGFETNLWIVSAGYGLISSSDEVYSYSATFTPGDKNSVAIGEIENTKRNEILSQWWNLISNYSLPNSSNPRKISQLVRENASDYFLVIASSDYLSAIEEDLLGGLSLLSSRENIIIITSKSFSKESLRDYTIPSDARLQCNGDCAEECEMHLVPRGVRGTISAWLASKIIERAKEDGFNAQKLKQFVEKRIEESPSLINFNRSRLGDTEVCSFINAELGKMPSASCAYLLRKLRDNNMACEQKRFRDLYWEAKGTQS